MINSYLHFNVNRKTVISLHVEKLFVTFFKDGEHDEACPTIFSSLASLQFGGMPLLIGMSPICNTPNVCAPCYILPRIPLISTQAPRGGRGNSCPE